MILPSDVLFLIFLESDFRTLTNCFRVSSRFFQLLKCEGFWTKKIRRDFPGQIFRCQDHFKMYVLFLSLKRVKDENKNRYVKSLETVTFMFSKTPENSPQKEKLRIKMEGLIQLNNYNQELAIRAEKNYKICLHQTNIQNREYFEITCSRETLRKILNSGSPYIISFLKRYPNHEEIISPGSLIGCRLENESDNLRFLIYLYFERDIEAGTPHCKEIVLNMDERINFCLNKYPEKLLGEMSEEKIREVYHLNF